MTIKFTLQLYGEDSFNVNCCSSFLNQLNFILMSLQPIRTIKSFVKRKSRLTAGQKQAFTELWPNYGIELLKDGKLNLNKIFLKEQPLVLEIGFGNGETLIKCAQNNSYENFIGVEVYPPGIGHCLNLIAKHNLQNIKIVNEDAVLLINEYLPDNCLTRVQIFFPDPWPKKRHHKRRLIQTEFVNSLCRALKPEGIIHFATDWQEYAEHALNVFKQHSELVNKSNADYAMKPEYRTETKFEERGIKLGHQIWDIIFTKK